MFERVEWVEAEEREERIARSIHDEELNAARERAFEKAERERIEFESEEN